MRRWLVVAFAAVLAACQSPLIRQGTVHDAITAEVGEASKREAVEPLPLPAVPEAVNQALLPPLTVEPPRPARPDEPRFDLAVNDAPAGQVFMAIVSGTRYSMVVHPSISEPVSIHLKDTTLFEALEALREVYGYEYKIVGTRIYIVPMTLQTRLFQVNYLASRRSGRADVRVSSGSIQSSSAPGATQAAAAGGTSPPAAAGTAATSSQESSRVTTTSENNFWLDLEAAIRMTIGDKDGGSVVINANSGVVMVRAFPKDLRAVEEYLRATALMLERQVMLEAKIIEVSLSDQFAAGINWAAFGGGSNSRIGAGIIGPGTTLRSDGSLSNPSIFIDPAPSRPLGPDPLTGQPGSIGSVSRRITTERSLPTSILGLAFQTSNFAALLNFLESQGTVHVLSSPRIATINNQKAVIKVGTDEFFVTSVETTTVATGASTTISPRITTQPFFSGIALDVTPQISDDDHITLHIHPSVSSVIDKSKTLDLGALGTFTLPLASSTINESDTIVRVRDGTIAAIGGLMRQQQNSIRSGLPGTSDSAVMSTIFGQRAEQLTKSELVILLKVTVIQGDASWQTHAQDIGGRLRPTGRVPALER